MEDAVEVLGLWGVVGLAAAIATALATGVSTVAALWWRRQDRREADWAWYNTGSQWEGRSLRGPEQAPCAWATIANVGDGTAFRVTVAGVACTARLVDDDLGREVLLGIRPQLHTVPAAPPGDRLGLEVTVTEVERWGSAAVIIEWTRSPTWKRKRVRLRVPLAEIAAKPALRT